MAIHLLGLSGSLRKASFNSLLVHEAARIFGPDTFTFKDARMPLYDGDLEVDAGLPDEAEALHAAILAADAVVISTPEYNQNLSGALKNALDWISRAKPKPLDGKPVAIMSAAAGRAGGARAQYSLRLCLQPFGARLVQTPEIMIAGTREAFAEDGKLISDRNTAGLTALMERLKEEVARG